MKEQMCKLIDGLPAGGDQSNFRGTNLTNETSNQSKLDYSGFAQLQNEACFPNRAHYGFTRSVLLKT